MKQACTLCHSNNFNELNLIAFNVHLMSRGIASIHVLSCFCAAKNSEASLNAHWNWISMDYDFAPKIDQFRG